MFAANIYKGNITLKEAKENQLEMGILLNKLKSYNPTNLKKIESKKETLSAATNLYNNRQNVIEAFVRGTFLYKDGGYRIEEESEEKSEEESEEESEKNESKNLSNILKTNQRA